MPQTIQEYVHSKVGSIWTAEDAAHVCHVVAEVDRTAIEMVRRSQDKTLAAHGATREMVGELVGGH